MEAPAQKPIEQQVHNPFFPRIDIQRAPLAVEIEAQGDSGPEMKTFTEERLMDSLEMMKAVARKIVQRSLVA